MKRLVCYSFIALCLMLLTVTSFSQTLQLEDSREFYTDIEGYHGLGRGEGATEIEALRIAKAAGIDVIFGELHKDDMFVEIFISRWPEAIFLEDSAAEEVEEGAYKAVVRIRIDQQAVLLTEPTYQESAVNLLDRAERILEEVEPRVAEAQGHEENMRLGEAYTNYKQSESRLSELLFLLDPLRDSSLQSKLGNSKPGLVTIAQTLQSTVKSGLGRLEEIEKETEVSETTEQIQKTYNLMVEEQVKIYTTIDMYAPISPFYDMQRSDLDVILLEIQQAIKHNNEVGEKLKNLKSGVPEDKVYLIEKIDLSYSESGQIEGTLKRLEKEVKQEIRLPRLVRQEREYKWSVFKENLGYALVKREPKDIFILRYYLPFGLNTGTDARFGLTREFEIEAGVEYYFNNLVWFQTALGKDDLYVDTDIKDIALYQDAHIAFGRGFLVGGGASWDWGRWVKTDVSTDRTAGNFSIDALIGGIDTERGWPWGILLLKIPGRPGLFLFNGKLNIGLEMKLRIAALFQIEAGISSGYFNIAAADDAETARLNPGTYLQYQLRYFGLFGVRLPKPFLWGIRFEGGSEGPSAPVPMLWRLFLQYSF